MFSKIALALILACPILEAQIAFPTATGYGSVATGGRAANARVVFVTNTDNSGVGSFRHAVEESTYTRMGVPRFIVFRVGGIITATSPITFAATDSCMTIAGQTAPGGGILVRGAGLVMRGNNWIMRGMRVFVGDQIPPATGSTNHHAIMIYDDPGRWIVDRCSFGWTWDNVVGLNSGSLPGANLGTFQKSIMSQGFDESPHARNQHEGRGMSVQTATSLTFYGNLISENWARNPHISGDSSSGGTPDSVTRVTWVNNMHSNWAQYASRGDGYAVVDWIENYYKSGRSQTLNPKDIDLTNNLNTNARYYIDGVRCTGATDYGCVDTTGLGASQVFERTGTDGGWVALDANGSTFIEVMTATLGAYPRSTIDETIISGMRDSTGFIKDGVEIDTLIWPRLDSWLANADSVVCPYPQSLSGSSNMPAANRWAGALHELEVRYNLGTRDTFGIVTSSTYAQDTIKFRLDGTLTGAVDSAYIWTKHTDATKVTVGYGSWSSGTSITCTPGSDTDCDGIPSYYEGQIGTDSTVADAMGDVDLDGYRNIEEYINHPELWGLNDPQVPGSSSPVLPKKP